MLVLSGLVSLTSAATPSTCAEKDPTHKDSTPVSRRQSRGAAPTSGRPAGLLNDQGELFHAISVGLRGDKEQPLVNLSALTGH